jgi:hypothetical protein
MKVKIGPYRNWVGPYQIADAIFFWVDRHGIYADEPEIFSRWDYRAAEKFGDWLNDVKWLVNLCQWIESKKKRKIKIHIDQYDTWSMDHTLALIIHPMLIQLKNTNHGYGLVDVEDAPSIGKGEDADYGSTDTKAQERWDWVMDEMIWAFSAILDEDNSFYDEETKTWNFEGRKAHDDRIANGLRLFGKYYRSLWD